MLRLLATVVLIIVFTECVVAIDAWLLGSPVTAPIVPPGTEIPQGHTPIGVVGTYGIVEWDDAAANYVNGLYGIIYENYTPIKGTKAALWFAQINSTQDGRNALRDAIARVRNPSAFRIKIPKTNPYVSVPAGEAPMHVIDLDQIDPTGRIPYRAW